MPHLFLYSIDLFNSIIEMKDNIKIKFIARVGMILPTQSLREWSSGLTSTVDQYIDRAAYKKGNVQKNQLPKYKNIIIIKLWCIQRVVLWIYCWLF